MYGVFERLPLLGVFASSSIIFSAAYTIYMFNRIAFAGSYSKFLNVNIIDLNKREFYILLVLVVFTVVLGIYPAPILDGLHYSVSSLVYIAPFSQCKNPSGDLYPLVCKKKPFARCKCEKPSGDLCPLVNTTPFLQPEKPTKDEIKKLKNIIAYTRFIKKESLDLIKIITIKLLLRGLNKHEYCNKDTSLNFEDEVE